MSVETRTATPGRSRSKTKEVKRGDPDGAFGGGPADDALAGVPSATTEVQRGSDGVHGMLKAVAPGIPVEPLSAMARSGREQLSAASSARLGRLRVAALRAIARKRGDEEPTPPECERAVWDQGLRAAYSSVAKGPRRQTAVVATKSPTAPLAPRTRSLPLAWSAAVGAAAFASRLLLAPWGAFWDPRAHLPARLPVSTGSVAGDLLAAIERIWLVAVAKLGTSAGLVLSVAAISSVALVSAVMFLLVFAVVSRSPASRRSALFVSAAVVLLLGAALNLWTPTLIPSGPGLIAFAGLSPLALLLIRVRRSSLVDNIP